MQHDNTQDETEYRFTQEFIESLDLDAIVHLVKDPAFTDTTGNVRVVERRVITPEGYLPESTDEEILKEEIAYIVKYELSNNIQHEVAYLQKCRYTINPDTNELKVIVHGIY
jgi:hypothetical protein